MSEGYFSELHKRLGDQVSTNLKRFTFKKEVLKAYNPPEFKIERRIMSYLTDNKSKLGLKFSEKGEFVSAILVDLAEMPKEHQDLWHKYLVEEKD